MHVSPSNDTHNPIMTIKTTDLFSGIGGIRLGFDLACQARGIDSSCVFASDISKNACKVYRDHFGNDPDPLCDITKVEPESLPDFDVLFGGFPCQPFSSSGHRKGFDDLRGTLFFNIAEIIKVKRPSAVLLENVKGLVNHDGGKTLNRIMTALRDQLGYVTYSQVLNSKYFGVPQNRPRIYIVAFDSHKKVNGIQIGQGFKFPEENGPDVRLSSILQPNPVEERYYLSKSYWETLLRHRKNHEAKGHGFGYEIKTGNDIANTIMCGGMGKERNLIMDDSQRELPDWANTDRIRTMTPIEWERLQGINEGWTEAAPVSSRMRLLGNSVTVPVIQAVSEKMLDAMVNPGTIEAF